MYNNYDCHKEKEKELHVNNRHANIAKLMRDSVDWIYRILKSNVIRCISTSGKHMKFHR